MGSKKGRTSGRSARPVAASYRDKALSSSSPSSSFSPETVSEGDSSSGSPSRLYWRRRFFSASCSWALRI
jgi:hypothetical protein